MSACGLPEQGCCGAGVVAPSGGELFHILRSRCTIGRIRKQKFGHSGGAQSNIFGAEFGAPLPYLFEGAERPVQGSRQGHDLGGCQGASAQELVEGARVEGFVPEAQSIGAIGAVTSNGVELGESGRIT